MDNGGRYINPYTDYGFKLLFGTLNAGSLKSQKTRVNSGFAL